MDVSVRLKKEYRDLIFRLEAMIASECYNPRSHDGLKNTQGCKFRYPVHYNYDSDYCENINLMDNEDYDEENDLLKTFCQSNRRYMLCDEDNKIDIDSLCYLFGSNQLFIGLGLQNVLEILSQEYGIDFINDRIKKYADMSLIEQQVISSADGCCALCGHVTTELDSNGNPRLYPYHLPVARKNSLPSEKNVVAVCPTCYKRLMRQNSTDDLYYLARKKGYKTPELPEFVSPSDDNIVGKRVYDSYEEKIYIIVESDVQHGRVKMRRGMHSDRKMLWPVTSDRYIQCSKRIFPYMEE
jgi:hypothetical protein